MGIIIIIRTRAMAEASGRLPNVSPGRFEVRAPMDLARPTHELLSALASGKTVGESIIGVMTRRWRPSVKQKQLFEWFRDWMAEGFFQAVEPVASKQNSIIHSSPGQNERLRKRQ